MKHPFIPAALALALLAPCIAAQEAADRPATVPPAAAEKPTPEQAAARVRQALQNAPDIPARDISVTVHGDTVILTGKVASTAQSAAAETAAKAATLGGRISNQLEVPAPEQDAKALQQNKLVRDVQAALNADARTANLGVVVSMDEAGVIGLHGLVPSRDSRALAERVASQVAGVKQLRNHLAVPGER